MKKLSKFLAMVLMAAAVFLAAVRPAAAIDAPKWVAAIYMQAQLTVGLRWTPVPGATAYKILRSEKAGADYVEIATSAQPQHFDKTAEPGTVYYYVLQAVAGAEASPNSEEKAVTIPGQKKALAPPAWAKDPEVQESTEFGKTSYRVGLLWKGSKEAIAYNVYRSTTPGKDYTMLSSVSESQLIDAAVEVGKTYYYVLSALDNAFQETGMSAEKKVEIVEVKKVKKKKKVKLVVAGRASKLLWKKERGDENGKFDFFEPFDIVVDEANDVLYATSNSSQQVYSLTASTGVMIKAIGGKGTDPGQFLYPLGLDVDADGVLYVVDRQKKNIQTFRNGNFVKEFPLEIPPDQKIDAQPMPMDIAIDKKTGDMYVADRGVNRIWVLDSGGKFQRFVGEPGTELGQIMVPEYLRFDHEGNLVVINSNQTRVSTYDKKTGAHLRSFGERRPGVGLFIAIGGLDFDKEGNVVVVDKSSAVAQGFLKDGRYLYHLANEKGDGGAPIFSPKTLAIDSKNRVYVAEGLVNRIQVFEITGAVPAPQEEADGE